MKIFVTDLEGVTHAIDAAAGWRVMELIRDHGFPMKAECGGGCSCATCHVYVDEAWIDKVTPRGTEEDLMLDEAYDRRENSRLSCQLIMTTELNGLRLTLGKND
ncbi:MAG: 2Fe-2S iron-sulfur cluster-binding protein [Alphaproteobacteria bacterium]